MTKYIFLILICAVFNSACQKVENTNANSVNKSAAAATNAPPEFSGAATNVESDPNAPRPTALPKGATPTPGIPSEEEIKKQMAAKPGKTPPIPGIPSEAELKRQMNQPASNQRITETKPPQKEDPNTPPLTPDDKRQRRVRKP